jgi:hypothetical protein
MGLLLMVIVITIEHVTNTLDAPGVIEPVVEHAPPAVDIGDGLSDSGALALGGRRAKGRAVGSYGGMLGFSG